MTKGRESKRECLYAYERERVNERGRKSVRMCEERKGENEEKDCGTAIVNS